MGKKGNTVVVMVNGKIVHTLVKDSIKDLSGVLNRDAVVSAVAGREIIKINNNIPGGVINILTSSISPDKVGWKYRETT